ncbi:MAG: helix-turn-helix domain-containing protein [Candidatus Omnitrophica bacterium]|nr:helix-turn-helix domain-containing protein [bacterium]MBW7938382.1 helix-turn-helix domain-containing protein [Candidatus Omnitrophota bacterium]MCE7909809.1 helix-turn-helix domain-containing protein [Candidatus Omnitrophica bacterium COP1]MCC6731643.1 helix-turn-helix domain-containing protein [Candidatus Omnitrophota bacterium]MCL4735672.1 helix-turn-helix domain-containing protein [Candidatus Omnitrophota bacterium]
MLADHPRHSRRCRPGYRSPVCCRDRPYPQWHQGYAPSDNRREKALRTAPCRSTTVTAEALRWGFWHLSDFSRAYKECFGELPSGTLRRKPEAEIRPGS